jgi:hypothetical protein
LKTQANTAAAITPPKLKTDTASRFTAISTAFLSAAALAFMSLLRFFYWFWLQ